MKIKIYFSCTVRVHPFRFYNSCFFVCMQKFDVVRCNIFFYSKFDLLYYNESENEDNIMLTSYVGFNV